MPSYAWHLPPAFIGYRGLVIGQKVQTYGSPVKVMKVKRREIT
jgi:hypothetical protein